MIEQFKFHSEEKQQPVKKFPDDLPSDWETEVIKNLPEDPKELKEKILTVLSDMKKVLDYLTPEQKYNHEVIEDIEQLHVKMEYIRRVLGKLMAAKPPTAQTESKD